MSRSDNQKLKLLYLSKIMKEKTDDEHYLTMPQIIAELNSYGIEASRKSIYTDIEALNTFGIDILKERIGSQTYYHCGNREFEIAELKFLVDAIQSSKFITVRKTKDLIRKLESLVSTYDAKLLEREVYVAGRIKNMDETIYYSIDAVHTAISEGHKLQFKYFSWNIKGEKEYRHNGEFYEVSPWALCWDDENYYMIGFDSKSEKLKHYRVDKMTDISIMNKKRKGTMTFKNQDKAVYTKKRFRMFDGEEQTVTLKCKNYLSNVIVDQFGKDVRMIPVDDEYFTVRVDVAVSYQFFGWIVALGGDAVIVGPDKVKEEMNSLMSRGFTE
ncbi:Predicted DNA-binding transcriptional regulator YafY, contains an HTH and WYL domains [Lachnospiraceae bacterium]|nr:Predicted DNA-binding transcriptional regulator YafY, contains an HTH and WYL domains [Lachnospiraceae bacterium]